MGGLPLRQHTTDLRTAISQFDKLGKGHSQKRETLLTKTLPQHLENLGKAVAQAEQLLKQKDFDGEVLSRQKIRQKIEEQVLEARELIEGIRAKVPEISVKKS